VLASGL